MLISDIIPAPVVFKEISINRSPSAESILNMVPKVDARFTQSPTQVYFPVAVDRRKIDEPGIKIFQLAACVGDLFDGGLKRPFSRILSSTRSHNHPWEL